MYGYSIAIKVSSVYSRIVVQIKALEIVRQTCTESQLLDLESVFQLWHIEEVAALL